MLCEPTPTSRRETADRIAQETEGIIIHPYDNYDVMAGQGTIGLELLEQVPDLDIVLVPISGGGMTAGIATAVKTINPRCKVSLTSTELEITDSLRSLLWSHRANTWRPVWPAERDSGPTRLSFSIRSLRAS